MKTPSNVVLYIVLGLLFCYLSFDFITSAKEDFFIINYNWEHFQSRPCGKAKVIDYDINTLKIELQKPYSFDNQKTYVVNSEYYFRAERIDIKDDLVNFIGIYWINEYPRNLEGIIDLAEGDLTLLQQTGVKIAMIGDSQMGWREGKYTRKWIAEHLKVHFIGNQYDVFGYPYFFSNTYESQRILLENLKYSNAEVIILYLGLREAIEPFIRNINEFSSLNKEKQIIIISSFLEENASNQMISIYDSKNVYLISISQYDKKEYFFNDGNHLNYVGHKKLGEALISKLKLLGIDEN
ncbi:MAG: hypothetical protein WA775_09485 [Psychroserpens sp.]|uniref:hypothetical protein n=1 Tax=Psychroserpens sp. TaxID=2020870 RepID=UPI003C7752F8